MGKRSVIVLFVIAPIYALGCDTAPPAGSAVDIHHPANAQAAVGAPLAPTTTLAIEDSRTTPRPLAPDGLKSESMQMSPGMKMSSHADMTHDMNRSHADDAATRPSTSSDGARTR